MKNLTAITIWVDESTGIKISGQNYNMIGYLITNSDKEEFLFLNKLKQARKSNPPCWNSLHGSEIKEADGNKIILLKKWLKIFQEDKDVYFHAFLYKDKPSSTHETYEQYFARQSVLSLALKMKQQGMPIETLFSQVKTLTILFDGRRSHVANIDGFSGEIKTINNLEGLYIKEIGEQIKKTCGKNYSENNFTVRFSFISQDCFDAMQFSDCLLYLLRNKIDKKQNIFSKIFDEFFLNDLKPDVKSLGFEEIYEYGHKFNFTRHE